MGRIDNIDAFQGKQAGIIIYSAVRNSGSLRFLLDRRRLNVAISRTRENLVIVGNLAFLTYPRNGCDDGEQRNYFSQIGRSYGPMKLKSYVCSDTKNGAGQNARIRSVNPADTNQKNPSDCFCAEVWSA